MSTYDPFVTTLEDALAALAGEYRERRQERNTSQAEKAAQAYRDVCDVLWGRGWRGKYLQLDAMLPPEEMPTYLVNENPSQ